MRRRLALLLVALGLLAGLGTSAARPAGQLSDRDAATAGPAVSVSGARYTFSSVLQGKPVRWNPCAPIHWRFRNDLQVRGGFPQVVRAVNRIAAVTGTTWVYDGGTKAVPTSAWLPRTYPSMPPVLIGWTTGAHSDLLAGQPAGVLGVTRTAWFGVTSSGRTSAAIRGAVIALDASNRLPLTGPDSWYTVTLHELGHAMGLGHAHSSAELMYPVLQPDLRDLQPGDITGLRGVGRSQGCITLGS